MTYNKKHKSYKKGKGRSHRRSSFDGDFLRALPFLILLVSGGVTVAVNLGLKSFLFPENKTELNENIVEEINEVIEIEEDEIIETEEEIEIEEAVDIDEEVYTIVQEMPRFPGCEDLDISIDEKKTCAEKKMLEYIYKNIKYPSIDSDIAPEGMIVITFIVDKEGNIIQPKILRGNSDALAKEYIRIIKSMPKWIPGKQRGKPVNVQFNIPFRINLRYDGN